MKKRPKNLLTMDECIKGRLYKINCRNLRYGVYDGKGGFIGIREKFGSFSLFTEYHWDKSIHHGTVRDIEDTGVDFHNDVNTDKLYLFKFLSDYERVQLRKYKNKTQYLVDLTRRFLNSTSEEKKEELIKAMKHSLDSIDAD